MVLSLVNLSLLSIANGIKDGSIQHPHFLPPKLRQRVLDTVLERGLINYPNCSAILSSVDFLNGMNSFGTEPGKYELEFLHRLETSMATVLSNGETVGAGITKLNLSVYGCKAYLDDESSVNASSFPLVSRLIAQCPYTTSLGLRGIGGFSAESVLEDRYRNNDEVESYSPWFPSVLNENDVCTGIMENLVDLSLRDMMKVLSTDRPNPIINFKRLTTLKLDDCSSQYNIWPQFLRSIPTLENLHMIGVEGIGIGDRIYFDHHHGLDWILPISMPHLKSLVVVRLKDHQFISKCNNAFVDNLMGCQQLSRVVLSLHQNSTNEESLERLAGMNIDLRVKAGFRNYGNEEMRAPFDSSSKFKIVRILHEKIDSFELRMGRKWSPQLSTSLEDVIDSCSNLTTFCLHIPTKSYHIGATEVEPVEMYRINAALRLFLGNPERAMQLKDLRLLGNFDESVISAVFDWCLNLERLEIWVSPTVRDQHLINWVSNGGGKLKHLIVFGCPNITSEGIIPILAKSAEDLLLVEVYPNQASGEGRNWETVLRNVCPNVISNDD